MDAFPQECIQNAFFPKTKIYDLRFAQESLGILDLKPRTKYQDLLRSLWGILDLKPRTKNQDLLRSLWGILVLGSWVLAENAF